MQHLLIATKNAHKTREIAQILGSGWVVTDLTAHAEIPAVEETESTFAGNAALKAVAVSLRFDGMVLADDSGLEVDALNGEPGVRSARYAGDGAYDEANREKLLRELERTGARGRARTARFRCAMALAQRGRVVGECDGTVEGVIINQAKGDGGFGYDPLFVPEGFCETFAQLPAETKNAMSHRGRALESALRLLESRKDAS